MTRHIFTFVGTFFAGALIALVARAAWFDPHANSSDHSATGGDYAPMVSNALAPANADPHAGHDAKAAKPVNTVCPICGMDVDPKIPPAEYKGKLVGFGCAACPPKFKKNPDRWGPAALKNQVVEN